jgi:hypothetical protein
VLLGGRDGVVIKMVNDDGGTVVREVNIEFEEEGADSARSGGLARESEEDVAVLVHEVQNVLGCQVGPSPMQLCQLTAPNTIIWNAHLWTSGGG